MDRWRRYARCRSRRRIPDNSGWLAEEWTDTTQALAKLVIDLYAFGSVREDGYVPSWSPDDDEQNETAME